MLLQHIENKACDLGSKDGEIIGQYDEEYAEKKSESVFPQVFVQRTEMFHQAKVPSKNFQSKIQRHINKKRPHLRS
jgi:hypothetical protein